MTLKGLLGGGLGMSPVPQGYGYPTAEDLRQGLFNQQNVQQAPLWHSLVDMLCMRLFSESGSRADFQDLHCIKLGPRVVVFAAIRDDYVVVEDDATMFPSDKLVLALRLLL